MINSVHIGIIQKTKPVICVQTVEKTARLLPGKVGNFSRRPPPEDNTVILIDLEEADGAFLNTAPKGLLRVNAQGTLAKYFVMPGLPGFLERYPDVKLHLGEDDRLVDMVREGVDCVLRAGALQDSSLVGRQIALMPQVTVASPAYLARFGEPAGVEDLPGHRAVDYISSATGRSIPLDFMVDGRNVQVRPGAAVSVTGAELYTGAALAGLGLAQVPRYRVERELAAGHLRIDLIRQAQPLQHPPHARQA